MICKMLFTCIFFATHLTVMRRLSSMPHYVIHKMLFSRETFFTNITTMGRFTGMFAYMIYHVFLTCKRFCTILTSKMHLFFSIRIFNLQEKKNVVDSLCPTYRYGVSPVWHLVWLSKCSFLAKLLPQTVQLYGLSVA